MSGSLSGKVAIVTGAGGGIGGAVAARLTADGATVIAADLPGALKARPSGGASCRGQIDCDVTLESSVADAFRAVASEHGRLDVLVHCAGVAGPRKRLHDFGLDEWCKVIDTNLRGTFLVMRAAFPIMQARGTGSIINIGSITGLRAMHEVAPYCASKAGMALLTRVAALEYAADGIRINAICPGPVLTPLLRHKTQGFLDQLAQGIPMGRLADPEEVAALAAFLASDSSAYMSGQCQVVDGGFLAA